MNEDELKNTCRQERGGEGRTVDMDIMFGTCHPDATRPLKAQRNETSSLCHKGVGRAGGVEDSTIRPDFVQKNFPPSRLPWQREARGASAYEREFRMKKFEINGPIPPPRPPLNNDPGKL